MASTSRGTIVRGIDHAQTFRFSAIFTSFRLATQPGRLTMALVLVVAMFVVGLLIDGLVGSGRVLPGEFEYLASGRSAEGFDAWHEQHRDRLRNDLVMFLMGPGDMPRDEAERLVASDNRWGAARQAVAERFAGEQRINRERYAQMPDELAQVEYQLAQRQAAAWDRFDGIRPRGVFHEALRLKVEAFDNLVHAAVNLEFGFAQLNPGRSLDRESVIGALRMAGYELPRWLWVAHPWFLGLWLLVFAVLWSLLGGAISRQAIVEAASGERISMGQAVQFAARRWVSFVTAPLMPLAFVALIGLVLAVAGMLFWLPVGNVVAAVLLVVGIPVGFLMAFLLVGWAGGVHLMYPALSAEGTDAFDALSRSYSYVLSRPWRFIFYTLLALGHGAITYLFVGLFVFLALYLVQGALSAWAGPVDAIFPRPELGDLGKEMHEPALGTTAKIAAVIVRVWVMLTVGLVAAYAVSYYFCAYSNIYLILRRYCDGTDMSELYLDADDAGTGPQVDKVEPVASPASSAETREDGDDRPPPTSDLDRQADDQ